jgi:hypothetical protein
MVCHAVELLFFSALPLRFVARRALSPNPELNVIICFAKDGFSVKTWFALPLITGGASGVFAGIPLVRLTKPSATRETVGFLV